jgi:LysR family carnitine catabolism transcriptional activator
VNLYHLKYFIDAAKLNSITESAKLNFVSQSAITLAIKNLEYFLDCKLITHERKKFELTEEGHQLIKESEDAINHLLSLRKKITHNSNTTHEITIACTNSFAIKKIHEIGKIIKKQFPNIVLIMRMANSDIIKDWVKNKEVDFGIMIDDGKTQDFSTTILSKGVFRLVKSKKTTSNHEMQNEIFITRKNKIEVKHFFKLLKYKNKSIKPKTRQISSWQVIKSMVENGHGIGLIPDYLIDEQVDIVHELPKVPYELIFIMHKASIKNPTLSKIKSLLTKYLN